MMNEAEVADVNETFFRFEEDGEGVPRPTLYDTPGPDRFRAVCLTRTDGAILITTDSEIVAEFLDA